MRLIDADKLIGWIEYWDKNITKDINAPDVGEANSIIKDVLQTVVDYVTDADALEWTPVSEGLPEDGEAVLVTEDWEGVEPFTETAVHAVGMFWVDNIDVSEHVTAWMRLPEPWEGEEE